ncbi:hypothetical protein MATL_G00172180 [Megalops atlanticus]|uniref:Uncharacterized protein n=1 Tax=Megalops atlanticus TaxID=7932 RepID=A0A9D3T881_MEGAT|nr:hypothetical protein MATL_G00172180 [Megalops atlanticus]
MGKSGTNGKVVSKKVSVSSGIRGYLPMLKVYRLIGQEAARGRKTFGLRTATAFCSDNERYLSFLLEDEVRGQR